MSKISVCVSSHDANSDVWDIFFHFVTKYWSDCKYDFYLTTETKSYFNENQRIQVINDYCTSDTWSKRLIKALKAIKEEYVLLIFDDFYILSKVNDEELNRCADLLDENPQIACFHYVHMDKTEGLSIPVEFEKYKKRDVRRRYWLNFLPALWRKEALLELLSPYENPWQAEWFGTSRAKLSKWFFYTLSESEEMVIDFDYDVKIDKGYGLCKGKWTLPTKTLFEKEGLIVDMYKRGFCDWDTISTIVSVPKMLFKHRFNYFIYGGIDEADIEVTKGNYRIPIRVQISLMLQHPKTFLKILNRKIHYLFGLYYGREVDTSSGSFLIT